MEQALFGPADILLPAPPVDLARWPVIACDQFTSQPDYWAKAEQMVGEAPSTLRLILPELYLEAEDVHARIAAIHAAMERYAQTAFAPAFTGYVYLERRMQNGKLRQGLVGCVDLEAYSFEPDAAPLVRPTENTVLSRIPPRLAVRRGALLESPHIIMLIDDEACGFIERAGALAKRRPPAYETELMLGGGGLTGWALDAPDDLAALAAAFDALAQTALEKSRCGGRNPRPFIMAVGDGNHSLATAKTLWEQTKPGLPAAEWAAHPARFCLVELENIHSEAVEVEPIHRILFGMGADQLAAELGRFAERQGARLVLAGEDEGDDAGESINGAADLPPAGANDAQFTGMANAQGANAADPPGTHTFALVSGEHTVRCRVEHSPFPLAMGFVQGALTELEQAHPALRVDYIHGEQAVRALSGPAAAGVLLPPFEKAELFRGVALGGVLPKKTFSMGHAQEKRYYLECRKILP